MKILFATPYIPYPPTFGGALRIFNLMKYLAPRHEVSIICYGSDDEDRLFRKEFGSNLKHIFRLPYPWENRYRRLAQFTSLFTEHSFFHHLIHTDEMQCLLDTVLTRFTYDIVQAEFSVMGSFHFLTDSVKVLDEHNVEYDNFKRMSDREQSLLRKFHYHRESRKFLPEEVDACRKFDAVFVTSERDKSLLDRTVPEARKTVVPNGVDTKYFAPAKYQRERNSIVFTGAMGYVPNYDGVTYFLDEIFPLVLRQMPDVKVYIVGNRPPDQVLRRTDTNVVVTGYVPDVRPYLGTAGVCVVPLRMGGGTRLKVLEAMSMHIPVVSTAIGCEGIEVRDGESLLVRDDPASFADAVVDVLSNRSRYGRMVRNAAETVHRLYDWTVIGEGMEREYAELIGAKNGRKTEHRTAAGIELNGAFQYAV